MTDRLKKIIIVGGVIIAIFLMITFFTDKGETDTSTVEQQTVSSTAKVVTNKAVATLSKIEKIDVSMDVFFDNTFRSLVDFSVKIFPEPAGRENPFAPVR